MMDAFAPHPVGLILLAAGESRRMGRAKQLLPFADTTLIRHACQTALATPARPVVVVLGANGDACASEIADLPVTCTRNPAWTEGMSGSLRAGLACLVELAPQITGAVILLVDQPLVSASDVTALLAAWEPLRTPIAAAAYDGVLGVPAVFSRALFPDLAALRGQEGARVVIARHAAGMASVAIPAATHDLDTHEDYRRTLDLCETNLRPDLRRP